jgi:hypothetical protein
MTCCYLCISVLNDVIRQMNKFPLDAEKPKDEYLLPQSKDLVCSVSSLSAMAATQEAGNFIDA